MMLKNIVEAGRPQITLWRMRITWWIHKAKNTHLDYVIIMSFPLQQLLHERASMLRLSHVAFLVCTRVRFLWWTMFGKCRHFQTLKYKCTLVKLVYSSNKRIYTNLLCSESCQYLFCHSVWIGSGKCEVFTSYSLFCRLDSLRANSSYDYVIRNFCVIALCLNFNTNTVLHTFVGCLLGSWNLSASILLH
jgi:hypothetical protein